MKKMMVFAMAVCVAGEVFAAFTSAPQELSTRVYGATNCFFQTAAFVGSNAGATIRTAGNETAADAGYAPGPAARRLSAWAETEGRLRWMRGKVGPELSLFGTPYNPATKIVLR